ncbi:MAG: peptidoglycan editing factor PgeF [Candidatus Aminicenantes bacterium]|nr:peptidoglycan editing factor PgeF [Candidatus Aminicenantes bacterium]
MTNERPFFLVPRFAKISWLVHGFGTARWTEPDLAADPEFRGFRPIIMNQVHSDVIHRLESAPRTKLAGDGLVTDVPGLLLVVRTADCLPVLLVDETRRLVGAVHCGWRGTLERILDRAVETLQVHFGSRPSDLWAAFGPCIGPDCYEVGPEVREEFLAAGFSASLFRPARGAAGKSLFDLGRANAEMLRASGLRGGRILTFDACTHCAPGFLSYRRDRDKEGRMVNFIGIKPPPR